MTRSYYNPLSSLADKTNAHHSAEMQRELRGIKTGAIPVRDKLAERPIQHTGDALGSLWTGAEVIWDLLSAGAGISFWKGTPDWTTEVRNEGGFTLESEGRIKPPAGHAGWYGFYFGFSPEHMTGPGLEEGTTITAQVAGPNMAATNSVVIVDNPGFRVYPGVSVSGINYLADTAMVAPSFVLAAQEDLDVGDLPTIDATTASLVQVHREVTTL